MSTNYNQKTIRDFYKSMILKITTDPSFERPYGCWNKTNTNGFIQDIFDGFASNPIVVADVNSCRDYSIDQEDESSRMYYSDHAASGKRYVSLDGKHRTQCILEFINGKFTYTGKVIDLEGNARRVRNKYFKDLTESERQFFLNAQICINEFQNLLQKDLARVFLSLNSNSALSNQHKRNAIQTPMSKWAREMAKNHLELMKSLVGEKSFPQMKPEEFISKLYLHCDDEKSDVGDGALNKLYKKGEGKIWRECYSTQSREICEKTLEIMSSINGTKKIPSTKQVCFSLICSNLSISDYLVEDEKMFVEQVIILDNRLEDESRASHVQDKSDDPEVTTSKYYFEQMRLNWNHQYRSTRLNTIWNEIVSDPSKYGLIWNLEEKTA